MVAVVGMGLGWRFRHLPLPGFAAKYGGDALWAWMVFLGLTVLFPRSRTLLLAAVAMGIAWTVEFLQLHHGAWLEASQSTRLGRLALGTTFNIPDLIAYGVGIGVGAAMDWRNLGRRVRSSRARW
ncbi:MAG: DUF2809 domain-containing protein [Verrucomicrobia bacterium]|nr:DUF2809 domain-containing protein [Verrucomicrobiota bacterium]